MLGSASQPVQVSFTRQVHGGGELTDAMRMRGGGVGACRGIVVKSYTIKGLVGSPASGPFAGQKAVLVSNAMGMCVNTAVSHENQCCSQNPAGCGRKFAWQLHERCWRAGALEPRLSKEAREQLAAFRGLPQEEEEEEEKGAQKSEGEKKRGGAESAGASEREAAPEEHGEASVDAKAEEVRAVESEAAPAWSAQLSEGQKRARELRRAMVFPGTSPASAEANRRAPTRHPHPEHAPTEDEHLEALSAAASVVSSDKPGTQLLPRDGFDPNI
jgi:hypothetical protein